MDIAPLRGLRYDLARAAGEDADRRDAAAAVTAPPYDVISPEEHRRLLDGSAHNIARLTLGSEPGGVSGYDERAKLLERWCDEGVLRREAAPCFYAYAIDYVVPGDVSAEGGGPSGGSRARFLGLIALGRLHEFVEGRVLPHEQTFPKVVEDRYRLLAETRTNLESIFLLYADPEMAVERLVEERAEADPVIRVEAKPGEFHAIHRLEDSAAIAELLDRFRSQRPIIADGHHRYTTSLRYRNEAGAGVPGSGWQLMTFSNLYSDGLAILATHRLVKLVNGGVESALSLLRARLESALEDDWELCVETPGERVLLRFPDALRAGKRGASRTSYALLHEVVLGDWLADRVEESGVRYFKEGTGETEALERGEGDLLFRLRPVGRAEFQEVVEAGDVFPHKTTYFYPKLWSGLVLWPIGEPG